MVSGSLSLPSRGSFHLSLAVLFAIGGCRVLSLGSWSTLLPAGFPVPRRTQARRQAGSSGFGYGAIALSGRASQRVPLPSRPRPVSPAAPCNPAGACPAVWAIPLSLAATRGVSLDFLSCRYSDGSLPCVFRSAPYAFRRGRRGLPRRVAPFGDPGIVGCRLLPPDYRGLPRPSSPGSPQASAHGPIHRLAMPFSLSCWPLSVNGYILPSLSIQKNLNGTDKT